MARGFCACEHPQQPDRQFSLWSKKDLKKLHDDRSTVDNTLYYGYTQQGVDQFQPASDIVSGANDITSAAVGANDPKFVNYPMSTSGANADFNTSWDFHLKSDSPALNKGKTNFTRHFASGLTLNGVNYVSPAPANYIGAFGVK